MSKEPYLLALYQGRSINTARIVAASTDPELVALAVAKMIPEFLGLVMERGWMPSEKHRSADRGIFRTQGMKEGGEDA